ncbi:MAG: BMP family ABC transporter substrate-binding protein, partial [Pseudomonadota bacterium]
MKLDRRTMLIGGGAVVGAAAVGTYVLRSPAPEVAEDTGPFKVGFVYVGPIGDHGWTYAHNQGRLLIEETFGDAVETTFVESVKEGPDAERVIRQLAESGHKLIFTTSFGFMNPTIKVAQNFPDVMFEHATGYQQAENVASYNARFFEGRAVIGTVAGHMSKSGKAGYIASFPIPEVVMGINSFTLAAQKVNPDFETTVLWVDSWFDPAKEADAAKALIDQGVDVLTQHTDSPAALQAAEERGVFAFGQASEMSKFGPNAHLTAILNTWGPYYVERVRAAMDGTWSSGSHWTGLKTGLVGIADYNPVIPEDVVAAAEAMR